MKNKILVLFSIFVLSLTSCAQGYKTFDSGLFSFEYPSKFNNERINNSPHMLLKLMSDDCILTIAQWDYNVDESVSIWDDEIYESYKDYSPVPNIKNIQTLKSSIKTKQGVTKCLKVLGNMNQNGFTAKVATYLFIHKGFFFIITVTDQGTYSVNSQTTKQDKLLERLEFK